MKFSVRAAALAIVFMMLVLMMPLSVFATETDDTTAPTETTAAAPTVKLSNLYVVGSNKKNYLADPSLSAGNNKYSFYLPKWMEEATIMVKSSEDISVSCDDADFSGSGGVYSGKCKLESSKNTFSVKVKGDDAERTLSITIFLSDIPCKLEKITLMKNSEEVKAFSEPEKLEYTFPSGTTSGVSLRIIPRHEQTVEIVNLTGIPEDQITGNEQKTKLSLHETYMRYDTDLTLVEGTNVFLVTVTAGTVKKECKATIIVGDPNANLITTTQSTEPTSAPTTEYSVSPIETQPTEPEKPVGAASSFPPVLWVTVGVVIAVVLGACIFMIVNMGNRNANNNNGGDYEYDYNRQPPRYPVRRNLSEYVDDEYDYGQSLRSRSRGRMDGGYYNANSYNNYSDGYGSGSGSYNDYDDGYGSGAPRGGSSQLGGFENDDDYGSGNYYGGY